MPNWCYTTLEVKGVIRELRRFDTQFKGKYESYSGSESSILTGEDVHDYMRNRECVEYRAVPHVKKFSFETEDRLDVNIITEINQEEGYSFNNFVRMTKDDFLNGWYDWSCKNWGTKWDLCDMEASTNDLDIIDGDKEGEIWYRFDTAWSPCIPVLIKMSYLYPDLEFNISYEDEGGGFAGVETYKAGVQTKEISNPGDENYRNFMYEHFDREYCKCNSCDALLEDYEIEDNDNKCPHCGSTDLVGYDGDPWKSE